MARSPVCECVFVLIYRTRVCGNERTIIKGGATSSVPTRAGMRSQLEMNLATSIYVGLLLFLAKLEQILLMNVVFDRLLRVKLHVTFTFRQFIT